MFVDRFVPSLICLLIDLFYEAVVVFKGRKRACSASPQGVVENKRHKTHIGLIHPASPPDPSARGSKRVRESSPEQESRKRLKVYNFSRPPGPMLRPKRKKLFSAAPTQSLNGSALALGQPSNGFFTSVVSEQLDIVPPAVVQPTQALFPLLDTAKCPKGDPSAHCTTGYMTGDGDNLSSIGEFSC
jgi:hypothetical protein